MKRNYILPMLLILLAFSGGETDKTKNMEKNLKTSSFFPVSQELEEKKDTKEKKFKVGDRIYVQYTAKWCGPCMMLKRKIKSNNEFINFARTRGKGYYFVDIDKNDANTMAWKSRVSIGAVPLITVFEKTETDWKLIKSTTGNQSIETIKRMIE